MQNIHLHRLRTHYRLPANALSAKRRLDRLSKAALDQAFALATTDLSMPDDAELCIRTLRVPVSLRLSSSERLLAQDWGNAMAQKISCATREGPTADVVYYHSRRQALADMALSIARNDLNRLWAWRQLGFWCSGDLTNEQALVELTRALCVEAAVISALRLIADAGLFPPLAKNVTDEQWEKLALAAFAEAGVDRLMEEENRVPSPRAVRGALRVLKASSLAQTISNSGRSRVMADKTLRAVAALAVLEVEPVLLHSDAAQLIVGLVADAIQTKAGRAIPTLPHSGETNRADSIAQQGSEVENLHSAAAKTADVTNAPVDLRQRGFTHFGGLLFLLHLISELSLPGKIIKHTHLGARPFVWVVHQLALTLANIEADDPAALAFAGLSPNAVPPSQSEEPARQDETAALTELAADITNRLWTLLEPDGQTEIDLREFVCARPAEIVADPGWIEARFSLDDVSTMIRRSGLDGDPDYVPWLGVVVRFVYE